jgi:hypothetical protein
MPKLVQPSSGNRCRKFYEDMRCADSLAPVDSAEDPLRRLERSFPPSTSSLIEGLAPEIPLPPMTSPNNLPPLGREHAPDQEAPATSSMEENRKLVVKIPDPLLTTLRATCAAKVDVSLLGKLQGKHPGLKLLQLGPGKHSTLHQLYYHSKLTIFLRFLFPAQKAESTP